MANFNISSFGRVLGWSAVMTGREILMKTAAMFFAFMVPFVIHLLSSYNETDIRACEDSLQTAFGLNLGIFIIIVSIGGSWIFSNMKTKEQRIMFKMLPASDLEKFVVRALYVTLVWLCMAIVAFCLADVLRMLVSLMIGTDVVKCVIPDLFSSLFTADNIHVGGYRYDGFLSEYGAYAFLYGWTFWAYSLYILGGTVFRRSQFVLTSLALFSITLALLALIVNLFDSMSRETVVSMINAWLWTGFAVTAVLGLFNWWLSYKVFCRMQVVNNKWLNL